MSSSVRSSPFVVGGTVSDPEWSGQQLLTDTGSLNNQSVGR